MENFTRLFNNIESTAVKTKLKEAGSNSSTDNPHNVAAILKSFSDHRSCKSTNLQQTSSQVPKLPRLDNFAVENKKLIERIKNSKIYTNWQWKVLKLLLTIIKRMEYTVN